jgi:hypothetical protein
MTFSTFNSDALSFSETFAGSIGASKSKSSWFGLVQSSRSWTVDAALDLGAQLGTQGALGVAFCNVTTHMIKLQPWFNLQPDPDFAQGVKILLSPNPKYEENVGNWLEFFQSWGMAQPMNIIFGGVAGAAWASEQASGALQGLLAEREVVLACLGRVVATRSGTTVFC